MIYFLLGEDVAAKDARIADLKKKILSTDAISFDYEVLHSSKLDPETLKKALMNLPALARQRVVVIRECHRLSPQNRTLILEFANKNYPHLALVLESGEWDSRESFVRGVKGAQLVEFKTPVKLNVFDMTKAIDLRKDAEALKILENLLSGGIHPLQIMGGLVWFWGKSRGKISPGLFEQGLVALQEADLNIKRSRLKPEYALELLVVKLCLKEVC